MSSSSSALHCKVCSGKGSSYEKEAYAILDEIKCINHFAVEAYAVGGQVSHAGQQLHLNKHAWDVLLAPPYKVLIEIQGEQHFSKLDTRTNSHDSSLADRANKDCALAAAAQEAGFTVVWLVAADDKARRNRWKQAITRALQNVEAGGPPNLYIA